MTGYRMHQQYSIIQSTPGYVTSGWAPMFQEQEITQSSSVSSDQQLD